MTAPQCLSRRAVLGGLSAGALGLAAPGLLAALAGCARTGALAGPLSQFFADPEGARLVGLEYLRAFPDEADRDRLATELAGGQRAEWEQLAASRPAALAEAVRERHRLDFRDDRVVPLRGWVLSQTEARLCALAALA